ncbi:MAG: RrF2 family transcriptional regulator [Verrucomicrobiales bacterium]
MFSLSQSSHYAIQALTLLLTAEPPVRFVREIAEQAELPPAYLAKIFKRLADHNIVVAKRGYRGGTTMSRDPKEISLWEISVAIDGPEFLSHCLLGQATCSDERACPTHEFWKRNRGAVEAVLKKTSLADVLAFEKQRLTVKPKPGKPSKASPGQSASLRQKAR